MYDLVTAELTEEQAGDEAAATVRAARALEDEAMEGVAIVLDNLTLIVGIGPVKAQVLNQTGLLDLASAEAAVIASAGAGGSCGPMGHGGFRAD